MLTNRNDILESFGEAFDLLVRGTYAKIQSCDPRVRVSVLAGGKYSRDADQDVTDMCFEVLCVLVDRVGRDELIEILETRIRKE